MTAGIKYNKTYYEDGDLKPKENIIFTISLFPLNTIQQSIYSDQMRNYLISYFIFSFFFFISSASSIENRIILKIDNSIITNVDVINEAKYLQDLNPNLQILTKNKILEIAKN